MTLMLFHPLSFPRGALIANISNDRAYLSRWLLSHKGPQTVLTVLARRHPASAPIGLTALDARRDEKVASGSQGT
jgi:hypothetical protein